MLNPAIDKALMSMILTLAALCVLAGNNLFCYFKFHHY